MKDGEKYIQAYAKLNSRMNLRGNLLLKSLLAEGQSLFVAKEEGVEAQPDNANDEDRDL